MCNNSYLSTDQAVESTSKRQKKNHIEYKLDIRDDSVNLPTAISTWILHIGVDLMQYQRSLYKVAKGLKKRYYRLQGNRSYESDTYESAGSTKNEAHAPNSSHKYENASASISQTLQSSPSSDSPVVFQETAKDLQGEEGNNILKYVVKQKPNSVVHWIRDVELYQCYNSIPKGAIGLDAASAAVVDSMRLKELYKTEGTKWILDMCCAPGGKLLATVSCLKRLQGEGINWKVIGLDSVKRRLDVCSSFLKREIVPDEIEVSLINSRAQDFREFEGQCMEGRFDRVLVDAECTHEGSLRSVIRTLKYWGSKSIENRFTSKHAESIISNQRELLQHAINLVRPGGLVIYSTCSLDKQQNELLVCEVLKGFDNLRLQQLPTRFCRCCSTTSFKTDEWPATSAEPFMRGNCPAKYFTSNERDRKREECVNIDSPVAIRFSPLSPDTDGIFIAGIRKL